MMLAAYRLAVAVGIAAASLLCPPVAAGTMMPIFGPTQFTRSAGPPQDVTTTFQNCEPQAQYKMTVVNGLNGTGLVSSAWIILNGTLVFGPSSFNQQVQTLESPITVQQNNTLDVTLASNPGSSLSISIQCISNCLDVNIAFPLSAKWPIGRPSSRWYL